MKITGIVAEYNPFHNGHIKNIEQARLKTNPDVLIVAMSPNFVQRGEPSILPKEERVKQALKHGVDLVVEIPTVFAIQSADIYAFGALSLLNDLEVDHIVFGTETLKTSDFKTIKNMPSPRVDEIIQDYLEKGYSYPYSKAKANEIVADFYLENPNDILGYSYFKTIKENNFKIKPLCYKRVNNEKSTNIDDLESALAIRNSIKQSNKNSSKYHFLDDYFTILKYKILTTDSSQLAKIHLVDEGIENLFKKKINKANSMEEFINLCTSKRYSKARIKRTILHILLNSDRDCVSKIVSEKPPYIRVLGYNKNGQKYLAALRKKDIKIITRFSAKDDPLLLDELKSTALYNIDAKEPKRSVLIDKEKTIFPISKR